LLIDLWPRLSLYFTQQDREMVTVLAGGEKRTQDRDIQTAQELSRNSEEVVMKRKKITTRFWDVVEDLKADEDIAAYIETVLEEGYQALVSAGLGDITRARGVTAIACEAGL
jgi:hypothetical protein